MPPPALIGSLNRQPISNITNKDTPVIEDSGIRSTDRALYHKTPAWHGFGIVVDEALSPIDALETIDLDYQINKLPLRVDVTPDRTVTVQGKVALVRGDTGQVISVVGEGYEVYQNREVAQLAHAIGSESGAKVESIFTMEHGREIVLLLKVGSWSLGDDRTDEFYLLHDARDGSACLTGRGTGVRVICRNTTRRAIRGNKSTTIRQKHTVNIRERIATSVAEIKGIRESVEQFRSIADTLAGIGASTHAALVRRIFATVYPAQAANLDAPAQEARLRAEGQLERFSVELDERLADPAQQTKAARGSLWGLYNAITQHIDHHQTVRGESANPEARRRRQILDDTVADRKDKALELVLSLT